MSSHPPSRVEADFPDPYEQGDLMDLESLISEVSSWPLQDRLRLIDEVWETISSEESGSLLTEAHTQELQRRVDAYRHDPKAGSPWEEVESRLRGFRP